MTILTAPTSSEVLAQLAALPFAQSGPDSTSHAATTLLAKVERGPFVAEITRFDMVEIGEPPYTAPPQITIDSSEQDGGQMFHDLTVLRDHVGDFLQVAIEIAADYKAVVG
ncbi:hypothetical protein [Antrihabitans spumae]|uniref:Uncharacterized protein n=1 Tax=Antrihabitans spumae TaxID=3373370 RepID=A0ABW7KP80_9NOCA